jgi:hypothetical protein
MAEARHIRAGQLERVALVVVPGAQIDRLAAAPALGHPEHVDEEAQALLGFRSQNLQVS